MPAVERLYFEDAEEVEEEHLVNIRDALTQKETSGSDLDPLLNEVHKKCFGFSLAARDTGLGLKLLLRTKEDSHKVCCVNRMYMFKNLYVP